MDQPDHQGDPGQQQGGGHAQEQIPPERPGHRRSATLNRRRFTGRGGFRCFSAQCGVLERGQLGCGLLDGVAGGLAAGRDEVVAGGDLGQPRAESLQVGFGLLDLGVGDVPASVFVGQFLPQLRQPFQDLGVFGVAGGVELGDHRVFIGRVREGHRQDADGAALAADPVGQPPDLAHHRRPGRQQTHRLLQVQRTQRPQLAPHLHPQRGRSSGGGGADEQPAPIVLLRSSHCYVTDVTFRDQPPGALQGATFQPVTAAS